jgi:hypothetical protein
MTFKTKGYEIHKGAIDSNLASFIALQFKMVHNIVSLTDKNNLVGDDAVPNSFSYYSPLCFETLSLHLQSKIEKITGSFLYPTYSYGRIYYKHSDLKRHIDRPSSEVGVTLTLETDGTPWNIGFKDLNGDEVLVDLKVGDMCVYQGSKVEHWRDLYTGNKHIQAFLFYVDVNGQWKDHKYDKRLYLGLPTTERKT